INDIAPSTDPYNLAICEILAGTASTSTVSFNGTAGAPTSWSDTSITLPVPAGATTGDVVVDADGEASNGVLFTVTTSTSSAPVITSVTPGSGSVGTLVTIAGSNFGSTQGTSRVTFNGTVAAPTAWSATSITVPVPIGATTGNVVVAVGGVPSNGAAFTVVANFTFQQVNYATPSTASNVTVAYNAAQIAGDTNVVVVGWSDTTVAVQSVTDAMGNPYAAVVGPTRQSGVATQVIYVATQIAAATGGVNLVTVTFTGAARQPDVRIAEYGGIDPVNPIDATTAAKGNSTTATSKALVTTNAADLVVAADFAQTTTLEAGSRYTSRVITSPNGDIVEDRALTVAGSYRARAPLSTSVPWIMQAIAFRAAAIH